MQLSTTIRMSILFTFMLSTLNFSYTSDNNQEPKKWKSSKTIIDKIEQNLLSGWTITNIDDDKKRFSEQMNDLGFTYGLTLVNKQFPTIINTETGQTKKYPKLNILISDLDKQASMKTFVTDKAMSGTFQYCFISSRKYLLTIIWPQPIVNQTDANQHERHFDIDEDSKKDKARKRLIKQLNWYFDMY